MKNISVLFLTLVLLFIYCEVKERKVMNNNVIVLKLTATYEGMVGYGYVYQAKIVDVIQGKTEIETLNLTILSSDKEYVDFLSSHLAPAQVIVEFVRNKDGEPYAMMPISGMVDKNKTSWIISKMGLPE